MTEDHPFQATATFSIEASALVVGWIDDAGGLGTTVVDYLNRKLACQAVGELRPDGFFPLAGVTVANDLAQFPESKFYASPSGKVATFRSDAATGEWYEFLSAILDFAEHHFHSPEMFTLGGMVTAGAHSTPRELFAVVNSPEMKSALLPYGVVSGVDYETPRGQRPTLSTYLLWLAGRRNIPAASLWVPVPFYMVSVRDLRACEKTIAFLEKRLRLGLTTNEIGEEATRQDETIQLERRRSPELDAFIRKVEHGQALSQEENDRLARQIADLLHGTG